MLCVRQDKPIEAFQYLEESLMHARNAGRRSHGIADIQRCLGVAACLNSDMESAEKWFQEALQIYSSVSEKSIGSSKLQSIFGDMGLASEWLGDTDKALKYIREAESLFEEDWSRTRVDADRHSFREIESARSLGPALQRLLLIKNLPLQALMKADAFRARALAVLLAEKRGGAVSVPSGCEMAASEWLYRIVHSQKACILYFSLVRSNSRNLFPHPTEQLCTWVVGSDGALRDWCVRDLPHLSTDHCNHLDEFVRYTRGCTETEITIEEEEENAGHVQDLESLTENAPDRGKVRERRLANKQRLRECYDLLILPFRKSIENEIDLIIVPDGSLWMLPFAALLDEQDSTLLDKFSLRLAPSLCTLDEAEWVVNNDPHVNSARTAVVVGNPTLADPLTAMHPEIASPLPYAAEEADLVASRCEEVGFDVKRLVASDATKPRTLEAAAAGATLLHFATHGILQDSGGSALAFAGRDGLLSASDLEGLKLPAKVAVLSACSTGRGELKSEGVIGLSRAFMAAGVPSVIMTLWKVSDFITKRIMDDFYREWLEEGKDLAHALRSAMLLERKREFSSVENWGSFVLVGCSSIAQGSK